MNRQERIRNRRSYKEFSSLLKFLRRNPKPSSILKKIHSIIDRVRGFRSETNSYYALESIKQLIKDEGLK